MTPSQRIAPEVRNIHAPAPLHDLPFWCVWTYEQRPGEPKPRKVPQYSMGGRRTGKQGSPEDLAKLTTFAVARDAAARRGLDGVGFALTKDAGIVALDFDHCIYDGKVDPVVLDLVATTYAEKSPSGQGVRAFFASAADILGNRKSRAEPGKFATEAFSSSGFVTVTGWMLDHVELLGHEDRIAPLPQKVIDFCRNRFGTSTQPVVAEDFTAGHEPKLGLSIDEMQALFAQLDPDMGRDDWIRVGMALHHECEGDDTGFDIWNDWSANGGKYPSEEALREQWDSFTRRMGPGRKQVTMKSVIHMTKQPELRLDASTVPSSEPPRQVPAPAAIVGQQVRLPEPFPGFMADVVRLGLATAHKRQPGMLLLGVLIAMAAACGSNSRLPDGMRLNLYGLSVAPTSSGKDHILHVCVAIARAVGMSRLGDLASGAGLEDALREGGMIASIDEIAHVLAARADRGAQHLRDVERMLLKLFSASKDEYITRAKAGLVPRTVQNPALNLIGFAVPAKLGEALTDGDVASGLLNRMLITVGDGTARPEPGPRKMFELDEAMLSKLNAVTLSPGLIAFSGEAEQRVEEVKLEFYEAEQALPEESPERLLLGRTLEKALRIAGVLAVFDRPGSPVVEIAHLEWAVGFARASDATLVDFLNRHMYGGKVQADAAKVASLARAVLTAPPPGCRPAETAALAAGHVPLSVIARRSRLDVKTMNDAIALLEMRGEIACCSFSHVPVVGRASKCASLYFPSYT